MISSQILMSVLVSTALLAAEGQKVNVKVIEVYDARGYEVGKFGERDPNGSLLQLKVLVDGEALISANSYGRLVYREAVDDLGNDLRPAAENGRKNGEFRKVGKERVLDLKRAANLADAFARALEDDPPKGFRIEMYVGQPPRKATKITKLSGEFEVMVAGEEKVLEIVGMKSNRGKEVVNPELEKQGLKIKLLEPRDGDKKNVLGIEFRGNIQGIKKDNLLDKEGKSASGSSSAISSGDWLSRDYELDAPLDDSMVLRLVVLANQKKAVVPFEFKDIVLP